MESSHPTMRYINDRLRNCLSGILGNLYLLELEANQLNYEQRRSLKDIKICADELNELADNMSHDRLAALIK